MKSYSILKLQELSISTEILRACPQITFETANLINKNNLLIVKAIKDYGEEAKLLQERGGALEVNDKEANDLYRKDIQTLNTKKFDVEVVELQSNLFTNIEGDKEVPQQNGTMHKYSYREAFFSLLGEIIVE